MKRTVLFATALAALCAVGALSTRADDDNNDHRVQRRFRADLRGGSETPAVSSAGRGTLKLKIDDDAASIDFVLSYDANLNGTVSVAHVHLGQRDVAGGVMFFLCGGSTKPACPPAPATITGTVVAADVIGPAGQGIAAGEFAEVLAAIRSGLAYGNVHTSTQAGGEIRGQLRAD